MKSLRVFNRRAGSAFAAAALVLGTTVPAMVSAATVTERSIALSSSSAEATDVSYEVNFTSPSATKTFVTTFCTTAAGNCTAPTGLNLAGATTATADYSVENATANTVAVELTNAATTVDVTIDDVVNPDAAGTMFARIATYAEAYASLGSVVDSGNVAISITDGFGVNGAVLETLTFCVSGPDGSEQNPITSGCGGTLEPADISLGTDGILSTTLSTGTIYTQLSTNANGGAVVSLKSDAAGCGGLLRDGTGAAAERCGIAPLTVAGTINDGDARFGVMLSNLGGADSTTTVPAGNYSTTNYYMGYDNVDESEGVTSPYGDPVYSTGGDPVSDGTADLTFGANMSNLTPAGNYSANFSLIATGKF